MPDINQSIPNVMPDAMVEPITDMELIVAKLKHDGKQSKGTEENKIFSKNNKGV